MVTHHSLAFIKPFSSASVLFCVSLTLANSPEKFMKKKVLLHDRENSVYEWEWLQIYMEGPHNESRHLGI